MSRRKINIEKLQALLNEIDYQDFITMLAVLGREHPLGGIKQIQKLEGVQYAVVYIRCFESLEAAKKVAESIEKGESNGFR